MDRESGWKLRARLRRSEPRPYNDAYDRLAEKFNDPTGAKDALGFLDFTIKRWLGRQTPWSTLEGKKVLELASGSVNSGYPPWFARLCSVFGANVVAIDVISQDEVDQSMFTCVQADLIEVVLGNGLDSVPELRNGKFDLIHASRFVGPNAAGEVIKELQRRGVTREEFEKKLKQQAKKLLANRGYMDVTDELSNG